MNFETSIPRDAQKAANQVHVEWDSSGGIMMNFEAAVKTCVIQKYFTFEGRASRAEFWWFYLFMAVFISVGYVEDMTSFPVDEQSLSPVVSFFSGMVTMILFLPFWGVMVRRLHDGGYSGWWLLLIFTGVGVFVLIAWWASKGENGNNRYGASPLLAPSTHLPMDDMQ